MARHKPWKLARLIQDLPVSEDSLLKIEEYLRHEDSSVRGAALDKLISDFPEKQAVAVLSSAKSSEVEPSIRAVMDDYLEDVPW